MSRYTYNSAKPLPPSFRTCPLCNTEFQHGDGMDAFTLLPDDDKNINKMLDDKDHECPALLAHTECIENHFRKESFHATS
ncbi:MAG: hypothetical protein JNL74_06485 [Fibrobacteres bacterium]|nr:hypothetical protein [Fibrobacterota bacterium]